MKRSAVPALSLLVSVLCLGQAPQASVALEAPARVGLPIWLKIFAPSEIRYPFYSAPDWHVCHDVEVRKEGKPFPRIQRLGSAVGVVGSIPGGLCGGLYLSGKPQHTGSIPLHVMYRFEQPGIYEVRYVEHAALLLGDTAPPTVVSPWTPIEILAATAEERATWLADVSLHAPSDATGLLSGYLPDILGVPDDQSLHLLVPYLNHPDAMVRQYVSRAVSYWPGEAATEAVLATIRAQGPSEESVEVLSVSKITATEAEAAVEAALPYLKSDSTLSLKGAIDMVKWIALGEKSQVSGELKKRAADALIDAEARVVALGDSGIANDYAVALSTVKDDRASKILWNFVDRGIAHEQAIICLAWLRRLADLPKLAQMAMPLTAQPGDPGPGALPYALRCSYGAAALPYIEEILQRSPYVFVRTASARELVNAGRPSGFAFIVDAIEQNRPYRGEMVQFLRDRFPELRQGDDAAALRLAQSKARGK